MADFEQSGGQLAITKDEHDLWVSLRGRPFTDGPMRHAHREPTDGYSDVVSVVDRVVANARMVGS